MYYMYAGRKLPMFIFDFHFVTIIHDINFKTLQFSVIACFNKTFYSNILSVFIYFLIYLFI